MREQDRDAYAADLASIILLTSGGLGITIIASFLWMRETAARALRSAELVVGFAIIAFLIFGLIWIVYHLRELFRLNTPSETYHAEPRE